MQNIIDDKFTIEIEEASGVSVLRARQILAVSIDRLWDFVSDPKNLAMITPPDMNFIITSGGDRRMYQGQIITYRLNPFPLLRTNWVTEITHVEKNSFFVDEQRLGPYRFWHHQHHLIEQGNRTEMLDIVTYALPYGALGRLVNFISVKSRLQNIFKYRGERLEEKFNSR